VFGKLIIGWFGEKKTQLNMWLWLNDKIYTRFHDVIFPYSNGTSQIDHILISRFGVFIVETKNKTGWIFGAEKQDNWTQVVWGKKYQFQNPLKQVYRQKKVLSQFLGIDERYVHTVVYFSGDAKFKTAMPGNVLRAGLSSYVKDFRDEIFSEEEISKFIVKIQDHILNSNQSTSDHVRSLRDRHNSTTICPKCGGELVRKTAKTGSNAGGHFLGCLNFPKCRFTRSL